MNCISALRRLLCPALILLAASAFSYAKDQAGEEGTTLEAVVKDPDTVLIYCDANYYPFCYGDGANNEKARGFYIDLLKAIFAEMKPSFRVKIIPDRWQDGLNKMKEGDAFALLPPYKLESRNTYLECIEPLYTETIVVIGKQKFKKALHDAWANLSWPSSFHGFMIGNNTGFGSPGEEFFRAVDEGNIVVIENRTTEENLRQLLQDKMHAYVNSRDAIQLAMADMPECRQATGDEALVEILEIGKKDAYLAFNATPRAKERYKYLREQFMGEFHRHLRTLKASGGAEKIRKDFFAKETGQPETVPATSEEKKPAPVAPSLPQPAAQPASAPSAAPAA